MKSILRALIVIALCFGGVSFASAMTTVDGSTDDANTTRIRSNTGVTQEQLRCLQSATMKRERALTEAFETFSRTMRAAYQDRSGDLERAWSIMDRRERKTMIENAWKEWKTSANNAKKARKDTHKTAWNTFKNEVKACKVTAVDIDTAGASADSGN